MWVVNMHVLVPKIVMHCSKNNNKYPCEFLHTSIVGCVHKFHLWLLEI
jgi:hypothetical protein